MKNLILILLLFISVGNVKGQLHSLSDQYILNGLAINPAYAGSEEAFSAIIMYRNQWTGFDGAPKTFTVAAHSPLRNKRVALGFLAVNDQIGVSKETSLMANYTYMIEMGDGMLSFGIGIGISFLSCRWDQLQTLSPDDIELFTDRIKSTNPDFSAGIYYNNDDFFMGLSLPFFLSYSYNDEELELKNDMREYNIYLTGGYFFELNSILKFTPSILLKYHPQEAFQGEITGQFVLKDNLWFGVSYRTLDAVVVIVQIQATNQLRIAYTYDIGLKSNNRYYGGSHEVSLKYLFNKNSRVVGPMRF